jgi:transposase
MGCGSGSSRCCRGGGAGSAIRAAGPWMTALVLQGILFVLHTGIGWEHLPQELGFGCGMTAWRRLRAWQQAGVWERLHALLLAELNATERLEWERAVADSSHLQVKKGAPRPAPARSTAAGQAASTTCS